VAFAEQEPPIAINLVHPKPVAWKALMQPVADALFEREITSNPLPFIPFSEWLGRLESKAKDVSEANKKHIVCISMIVCQRSSLTFSYLAFDYSLPSSFSTSCVS
jgi:hypothetical protein